MSRDQGKEEGEFWGNLAGSHWGVGGLWNLDSPNSSLHFLSAVLSSPQPGPSNGVAPLPRSALLIQLATARPRPVKARPLNWRVQSKDWPHAGRPAHELRYSIYRDLWERGFFLSAAGKFGGDFLVYPGEFGLRLRWLCFSSCSQYVLHPLPFVFGNTGV
jgi:tRNA-splicing endonuclease subunit Sen34